VTQLAERRFLRLGPQTLGVLHTDRNQLLVCFGRERFGNSRVKNDGFAVGSISADTVFIVRDRFGVLHGTSIRW
jgi:hypothetical protein